MAEQDAVSVASTDLLYYRRLSNHDRIDEQKLTDYIEGRAPRAERPPSPALDGVDISGSQLGVLEPVAEEEGVDAPRPPSSYGDRRSVFERAMHNMSADQPAPFEDSEHRQTVRQALEKNQHRSHRTASTFWCGELRKLGNNKLLVNVDFSPTDDPQELEMLYDMAVEFEAEKLEEENLETEFKLGLRLLGVANAQFLKLSVLNGYSADMRSRIEQFRPHLRAIARTRARLPRDPDPVWELSKAVARSTAAYLMDRVERSTSASGTLPMSDDARRPSGRPNMAAPF
jgi:hypothetical protein